MGVDDRLSCVDRHLTRIREHIRDVCHETGRDPEGVTILAAIKAADAEQIRYAHRVLGLRDVGENRVQQLLSRYDVLNGEGLHIHFIGTLQTNKVKYIIDKVDMIQSLDSLSLAKEIERQAARVGRVMDVLIEINSGSEESKGGVLPTEAESFARQVCGGEFPRLRLCGFMTMAPRGDEASYRRIFADTRRLCAHIWEQTLERSDPMVLSMGMSESYAPAVAEGATMVRIGRGLFACEDQEG